MFNCPYQHKCQSIIEKEQKILDKEWELFLGTKKNLLYYLKKYFGLRENLEKPKCNTEGGCYIYNSLSKENIVEETFKLNSEVLVKKRKLTFNENISKGDKYGNK